MLNLVLSLAGIFALIVIVGRLLHRYFIYIPDRARVAPKDAGLAGVEEVHQPGEHASDLDPVEARRVELIPKQMRQDGREGLAGWLRTTWMPYTHRVPEDLRDRFVNDVLDEYLAAHPAGPAGEVQVQMVRLEVEAVRLR